MGERDAGPMKTREQRDLFPGALEMMILRTLKRQPLHGYALAQHIKRTSNDLLQIEEGSLYPALQRLLKEELLRAEWGISSTNRRVRIYKLTAAGAGALQAGDVVVLLGDPESLAAAEVRLLRG